MPPASELAPVCPAAAPFPIKVKCDLSIYDGATGRVSPDFCEQTVLGDYAGYVEACRCSYENKNAINCESRGYTTSKDNSNCVLNNHEIELDPFVFVDGLTENDCYINADNYCNTLCKNEPVPEKSITCCASLV